jgi:hypothetical protein
MKQVSAPRTPATLSDSVHRQLNLYALAASAAGIGLLSVPAARAEIVYTPTNVKMDQVQGFYPIDFDNNGVVDLGIWLPASCSSGGCAFDMFGYPNSVIGDAVLVNPQGFAQAMRFGGRIDQRRHFVAGDRVMGGFETFRRGTSTVTSGWVGPWANNGKGVKDRYLGVKFLIDGQFHYGWTRITFVVTGKGTFEGVLTGYAYETIPKQGLTAGQTTDADGIGRTAPAATIHPTIKKPALGHLAAGAGALSSWRNTRTPSATIH